MQIKGWKQTGVTAWASISSLNTDPLPFIVFIKNYSIRPSDVNRFQPMFGRTAGHAIPLSPSVYHTRTRAVSVALRFMKDHQTLSSQNKYWEKNLDKKCPSWRKTYELLR